MRFGFARSCVQILALPLGVSVILDKPFVPFAGLPHYLRWCVLSTPEIQKCGDMAVAFSRQRLKPEIQCVSAESPQQCMERIQVGAVSRGQIGPGGQAVAVPGMVLTGPPSAYLEDTGQPE